MLQQKTHWVILFLLSGLILPATGCRGNTVHKITVSTYPLNIKANQPFNLIFSVDSAPVNFTSNGPYVLNPKTNDFIVDRNLGSSKTATFANGKMQSQYAYIYIMVPKRSGDLLIMPWTAEFDSGVVYISDTFKLHVSDERISSEDSLKSLQTSGDPFDFMNKPTGQKKDPFFDDFFKLKPETQNDGLHFVFADSVYKVVAGQAFQIKYTMTIACNPDANPATDGKITVDDIAFPTGITKISDHWETPDVATNTITNNGSTTTQKVYTKTYTLKLLASKHGTYYLPEIAFVADNKRYTTTAVKIIAK